MLAHLYTLVYLVDRIRPLSHSCTIIYIHAHSCPRAPVELCAHTHAPSSHAVVRPCCYTLILTHAHTLAHTTCAFLLWVCRCPHRWGVAPAGAAGSSESGSLGPTAAEPKLLFSSSALPAEPPSVLELLFLPPHTRSEPGPHLKPIVPLGCRPPSRGICQGGEWWVRVGTPPESLWPPLPRRCKLGPRARCGRLPAVQPGGVSFGPWPEVPGCWQTCSYWSASGQTCVGSPGRREAGKKWVLRGRGEAHTRRSGSGRREEPGLPWDGITTFLQGSGNLLIADGCPRGGIGTIT